MPSIQTTITKRLAKFSIEPDADELAALLVDNDLVGSEDYTADHKVRVQRVQLSVVSDLLAMPDVTEGGMSLKWDRAAVQVYCNQLRSDLGLTSSSESSVSDRSYLW